VTAALSVKLAQLPFWLWSLRNNQRVILLPPYFAATLKHTRYLPWIQVLSVRYR
jgi:hypothetical protein